MPYLLCGAFQKRFNRFQILRAGDRHVPVSYTHLDVYKRQVVASCQSLIFPMNISVLDRCLKYVSVGSQSVSYTHLDVYKRQVTGNSGFLTES